MSGRVKCVLPYCPVLTVVLCYSCWPLRAAGKHCLLFTELSSVEDRILLGMRAVLIDFILIHCLWQIIEQVRSLYKA